MEAARRQMAGLLGCSADELIFTSGGTESNNQAFKSIGAARFAFGNHIITSQIEHPAVLEVCRSLERYGFAVTYLPVDGDGLVDPAAVAAAITPKTIMISIMHANNEVGTLQPIAEIAEVARETGILMHTDAAQSLGKVAVQVDELGVDLLSVAGHKLYAPKGVGALYIRYGLKPEIFCHGAGQERGIRAGTENVLGIVGLGKACEIAGLELTRHADHMRRMRDRLEEGFADALGDIRFNGHRQKRLPNTVSVSFFGPGGQPYPGRDRPGGGRFGRGRLSCRSGEDLPCARGHADSRGLGEGDDPLYHRQDDHRRGNRPGPGGDCRGGETAARLAGRG